MLKSTCLLLYMYFLVPCEGYNYEQPWPVLVFEKGTQANIPCIVEGESDAYFWKKGTTYQTSKHVAANVHGEPDTFANTTHGKITVTGNGTLLINNISFEDDSTYFCRVVSEESEHYANVTVYTQVSLNSYSLSIEQCPSLPDCKLYLRPGTLHTFTCTASFVSPMVDLQWGSDQTNVTTISRILKDNSDGSVNISVGIAIDYERPSLLRCGANSPSMRGEVIIVELENEGEHESGRDFTLIVIVLILVFSAIGICLIVLLQKKPWKRKKLTQRSGNEYEAVSSKQPSLPQEELEYKDQQPSPKQEELECKDQQPSPKQKELEFKDQWLRVRRALPFLLVGSVRPPWKIPGVGTKVPLDEMPCINCYTGYGRNTWLCGVVSPTIRYKESEITGHLAAKRSCCNLLETEALCRVWDSGMWGSDISLMGLLYDGGPASISS